MSKKDNGHYIGLDRNKELPEGHKNGHYISGVDTESGNHKDGKRFPFGKKNPALDDLEAGDPNNNKEVKDDREDQVWTADDARPHHWR